MPGGSALFAAQEVSAGYLGHPVIQGVGLEVHTGQLVALFGPNGAGKTTTLLALAGCIPTMGGSIQLDGESLTGPLHRRAKAGISLITEERAVFMELTVAENLHVGRCDPQMALDLFPELAPMLGRSAGVLSGGELQMLSLGRALARSPRVLLIDELSLGLAPLVVDRLMQAVREAADRGVGVLMVEQHVSRALSIVDYAYVMQRGRVAFHGFADQVKGRIDEVEATYLPSLDESTK